MVLIWGNNEWNLCKDISSANYQYPGGEVINFYVITRHSWIECNSNILRLTVLPGAHVSCPSTCPSAWVNLPLIALTGPYWMYGLSMENSPVPLLYLPLILHLSLLCVNSSSALPEVAPVLSNSLVRDWVPKGVVKVRDASRLIVLVMSLLLYVTATEALNRIKGCHESYVDLVDENKPSYFGVVILRLSFFWINNLKQYRKPRVCSLPSCSYLYPIGIHRWQPFFRSGCWHWPRSSWFCVGRPRSRSWWSR